MRSIAPIPVDLMQSWLDVLAVWATVGAAVVTAITAVLIWLQILQTKRSVEATEQTLTLAREEQEQNRDLIANARKSRIDAELPKILVWIHTQTRKAHDLGVRSASGAPRPLTELPAGKIWSLPEDGASELIISLKVAVSNDGPRRARVTLAASNNSFLLSENEQVISVGEETVIEVRRKYTIQDWAAMSSEIGTRSIQDVLTLTYVHQGTEGAIERWVVRQSGSPLVPVPGSPDCWQLGPFGARRGPLTSLAAEVEMPHRDYYSSMSDLTVLV